MTTRSGNSPSRKKSKREEWKTLTPDERLDRVGTSVQNVKDRRYAEDSYVLAPIFETGDPVVVCREGIYYNALIGGVLKKAWDCPELKKKVPLYRVKYPSMTMKSSRTEEIVEYDLIGLTKHSMVHELLYAHYWNKHKLQTVEAGRKRKKNPPNDIFELSDATLQNLEKKWQEYIQQVEPDVKTYAEWIGME